MHSAAPPVLPAYSSMSGDHLSPNEPDTIDLAAIIRFIRKGWRLCLIWIFVGLCAGVAFTMLAPAYFTAFAIILLEDRASRAPTELASAVPAVDQAFTDSQIEDLRSDEVIRRVVDSDRLAEVDEFGTAGDSTALAATESRSKRATVTRVRRGLTIRRLGVSNAVEIGFTSRDPLRSAAIANAIAQSYIDNQIELKRRAVEDAASLLRQSLAEVRNKAFGTDPPEQNSSPARPESAEEALARSREAQNSADAYRALYNSLLQRTYTESAGQFSFSPAARVITSAEPPSKQSWPPAILVLAIAVAGSAAGGFGHALLRQATDHSLETEEDVRRSIDFDRVTVLPKIRKRKWDTRTFRQKGLQPAYLKASATFYDTIGKLAVRLQSGQGPRNGFVIAVAAPTAGAGASSVAVHLARIIAECGQKTVLVDANWRSDTVDQALLEPTPGRGLATGLAAINIGSESLDVLLLRPRAPISELNASLSIAGALQQLRAQYDCVVVDFHSADRTGDFEAYMTTINEVIVVVEARRTSAECLTGFLRPIPGNKVVAVVLNKA
jgi:Mrp family chromosome partitioning ATPase